MKMDFKNYDFSQAERLQAVQPNSGRHSPAAPFSFFAFFGAVGEILRAAFFIFFLICLGGSLPLAILLMIFASY